MATAGTAEAAHEGLTTGAHYQFLTSLGGITGERGKRQADHEGSGANCGDAGEQRTGNDQITDHGVDPRVLDFLLIPEGAFGSHDTATEQQVIGAALYLPPGAIRELSHQQLHEQILRPVPAALREDADALYERHVKGVYSDILDFMSRMDLSLLPEQQQALLHLGVASRDLVEAVKAAKHLQTNLRKQIDNTQPPIREAYDLLREQCGLALMELERLGDLQGDTEAQRALFHAYEEQEKLFAEEFQRRLQARLRNRELDGWQATSLLNDMHYLLRIRRGLQTAHAALADRIPLAEQPSLPTRERVEPSISLP